MLGIVVLILGGNPLPLERVHNIWAVFLMILME